MPRFNIKTFNSIAKEGLERLPKENYGINKSNDPEAIILRSYNFHAEPINPSLIAVARAGAGFNNIPLDKLSEAGIVAFNTPGANANSVKELVLGALIAHSRNMFEAKNWSDKLSGENIRVQVEAGKKLFKGYEISGKTLGVIGLGAVGLRVANDAKSLGMDVIGHDPYISIDAAWNINRTVDKATSLEELLKKSDFITVHVPMMESTKGIIDAACMKLMKLSAVLLNFSRDEIIDESALIEALDHNRIAHYITDFPHEDLLGHEKITLLPHLGASTDESESNSAIMAVDQLKTYLETGNITNSINYPRVEMSLSSPARLAVCNHNVKNIIANLTNYLSMEGINIDHIINKSRGEFAYTLVDITETNEEKLYKIIDKLEEQEGILKVRLVKNMAHNDWYN